MELSRVRESDISRESVSLKNKVASDPDPLRVAIHVNRANQRWIGKRGAIRHLAFPVGDGVRSLRQDGSGLKTSRRCARYSTVLGYILIAF
jgi:hypothetical protein